MVTNHQMENYKAFWKDYVVASTVLILVVDAQDTVLCRLSMLWLLH